MLRKKKLQHVHFNPHHFLFHIASYVLRYPFSFFSGSNSECLFEVSSLLNMSKWATQYDDKRIYIRLVLILFHLFIRTKVIKEKVPESKRSYKLVSLMNFRWNWERGHVQQNSQWAEEKKENKLKSLCRKHIEKKVSHSKTLNC